MSKFSRYLMIFKLTRFYRTSSNSDYINNINNYSFTDYSLWVLINNCYEVVNVSTHGSKYSWKTESYGYNAYDAESQSNILPSVINTSACHTNAFDDSTSDCLGEAFIFNGSGGAITYAGCSRYGAYLKADDDYHYGDADDDYHYGEAYDKDFLYAYFNKVTKFVGSCSPYSVGEIVKYVKTRERGSINEYNAYRWLLLTYNLLGDPTFRSLYKCQNPPIQLEVVAETRPEYEGYDVIRILNPNKESVNVVVISADDFGDSYCKSRFNVSSSEIRFSYTPKHVKICVYSDTHEPYITDFVRASIDGAGIVVGNTKYEIKDLPEEYEVKWSLGSEIKREKSKSAISDGIGIIDPGISFPIDPIIDAILYVEKDSSDSHKCTVKHGDLCFAEAQNYEVPLIADIYLRGNHIGTVKKDIIDLNNLYLYVSQEAADIYPGIAQFEISDNCIVSEIEIEDPFIGGFNSMIKAPTVRGMQPISDPIYVYKKGRIKLSSPLLKYCNRVDNMYFGLDYLNFDKEQQTIELEIPYTANAENSVDLNLYFDNKDYPMRTLCFMQVESEEPAMHIIHAFVETIKVGFTLPKEASRRNWKFELYDATTGALVHTESGNLYHDTYTIKYFAISGTYILNATNSESNLKFSAKLIKLPY